MSGTSNLSTTGPLVTISQDEYKALLYDSAFLDALRQTGVDNWEGYSEAVDLLETNESDDPTDDPTEDPIDEDDD